MGNRQSSAFTLIELMIVIGIIGLVVALGVPLFGVLTGARSQEAGQNLVAAAIGQARTIALSEGKYAGVLFYIDPATERTAMTVVVVQDPASGLEDPDPYDKYKAWTVGQEYRASAIQPDGTPIRGDRVISLTSDATATFKNGTTAQPNVNNVYNNASLAYSNLSNYFGNFKPIVPVYRARVDHTASATGGNRPPRNGPFGASTTVYRRIVPAGSAANPTTESNGGTFQNDNWTTDQLNVIAPSTLAGGERQLLPLGVGVQIIIQPTLRADLTGTSADIPANRERYVRTGLIMFDPQGKLTLSGQTVPYQGPLGAQLGLTADVGSAAAGVGVVLYDRAAFRLANGATDADFLYQNVAANTLSRIQSTQSFYNDNVAQPDMTQERAEETWLDSNTVPLLINRYSGALSEAQ